MSLHHIHKGSEYLVNAVLIKAGCLVIVAIIAFTFPVQNAEGASLLVAFGGRITTVFPCSCPANPGVVVTVFGPKGGRFFISPYKTKPYANYVTKIGGQMKGLAYPVYNPCLQFSPVSGCVPSPNPGGLLVEKFGTTLR